MPCLRLTSLLTWCFLIIILLLNPKMIICSTTEAGEEVLSLSSTGADAVTMESAVDAGVDTDLEVLSLSELKTVVLPQPYGAARAGAAVFQVFQNGNAESGVWQEGAIVHAGISAAIAGDLEVGTKNASRRDGADCMVFGFEDGGCNVDSGVLWNSCIVIDLDIETDVFEEALFEHHSTWSRGTAAASKAYNPAGVNCFDYVITFMNKVGVAGRSTWSKLELSKICLTRAFADAEIYAALFRMLQCEPSRTMLHKPSMVQCTLVSAGTEMHVDAARCAVCRDYSRWRARWAAETGGGGGGSSKGHLLKGHEGPEGELENTHGTWREDPADPPGAWE